MRYWLMLSHAEDLRWRVRVAGVVLSYTVATSHAGPFKLMKIK